MHCTNFLGTRVASDKLFDNIDLYFRERVMDEEQLH